MPTVESEPVDIRARKTAERGLMVCLETQGKRVWVPARLAKPLRPGVYRIPDWLARDHGLVPLDTDRS